MSPVRFLVSIYRAKLVAVIFSLSKVMPFCSYYKEKKLVYIIIAAPFSWQPFFFIKCTKLNIYLFCNIRLVFNAKYIFIPPSNTYSLS